MRHARSSEGEMIMANDALQTFVGPRILIKFAGAWEQAQAYEYMTAVYDTGFQSWISKCDVPANTPLVEGDYWMKWSDPNAQFQLLQQTVQTFDQRITNNTSDVASLETAFNNSEAIKWSDAIKYSGTNLVVFGDSYSQSGIPNSIDAYWPKRVANAMGATLYNFAVAGAGFGRTDNLIQRQVNNAVSTMTSEQKTRTSVIVAYAGENDLPNSVNATQMVTGIGNLIQSCLTEFPNAKIVIVPINWYFGRFTQAYWVTYTNFWNSVYSVISSPRVTMVPGATWWLMGRSDLYQNDGHPSQAGYDIIAGKILNAIYGGEATDNGLSSYSNTPYDEGSGCTGTLTYTMLNGTVYVNGTIRNLTAGAGSYTPLAHMPSILVPAINNIVIPCTSNANPRDYKGIIILNTGGAMYMNVNADYTANEVLSFNAAFVVNCNDVWPGH